MSERVTLPNRRMGATVPGEFGPHEFLVTFNPVPGPIQECFCSPTARSRTGTEVQALITDAAILMSILLQLGSTLGQIVAALGEDRAEGQERGPPSSILGAIARAGQAIEVGT